MKYPDGMEEDVVDSPGMPSVGPGSKGKTFPMGEPLLLVCERERERMKCFSWVGK
jgi:hypothetical protein